ncbi:UDP-3-O-(3-hydroxymyristoyl)glucosamine N-acyltransferase [Acidimangrovimonas sediminis]|uniref:UDP-3-O-(3-hydroxymyristoyl)glucosamine N-acyltransferase n=1 Tax=Acidimangrovimonas sediminis TaxID=2056283 RepID=UPI000C7F9282|nr:UDP-3-O-(3-hydroxymyristoyl)glucosamine N-acyltransferase [Acidimangrovimonas sediminis]
MSHSIQEIAAALDARVEGDGSLMIRRPSEPAAAGPEDLALAMDPRYAEGLSQGRAQAAILWDGADWQALGLKAAIFVPRPRYAMAGLTRLMDPGPAIAPGIHPMAAIDATAEIGEGAAIGPFVSIGPGAKVGPRARIASHVSIGAGAIVGADAMLLEGVRIGHHVRIGDRFIGQPGAVVGADGLSFVTPEKSGVEEVRENLKDRTEIRAQSWTRIHSLGSVTVGDDVELGANTCVDRGTIRDTVIGSGCKIDNLCHIAHNVVMGRDCLMAAQTGIAGSTRIGDRLVMGGQAGIADNLQIGNDVICTAAAKVLSNVPAGRAVMGYPAMKMETNIEAYKALRRLPRLAAQVAELQKAVSKGG